MLTLPPITFYSLLVITTTAIVSLGLFFPLIKNRLLGSRPFFWHWALGFAIFSFVHVPVLVINLGVQVGYQTLMVFYHISFFAMVIAYLLLYRGVTLLLTKNKFWLNKFPLIVFLYTTILTLGLFFVLKFEVPIIMTVLTFTFTIPMNLYLGYIFLYFYRKGSPYDTMKKSPVAILLGLTWFYVLILDIIIWYILVTFPVDFWIMKVISLKGWFVARAIANLLILVSFILYNRSLQQPKIEKKV